MILLKTVRRQGYLSFPKNKIKKSRAKRTIITWDKLFYCVIMVILLIVIGYELELLHTELLIKGTIQSGINYDAFRELQLDEDIPGKAEIKVQHLIKRKSHLKNTRYIDAIGYLTFSMMVRSYNLIDYGLVEEETFYRGIGRIAETSGFQELYGYYKAILLELEYFPIPEMEEAEISYEDSWYYMRSYGGKRRHEGTDLMASNNLRGYFPIISMTDGTIEKMGWLEQGGYRIGIRSKSDGYFYYAHLASYAPELKQGEEVIAGQLIGFMGDSGYGSEGTIGKFAVHLHLGIYVNTKTGEMSVNPYRILQILEDNRISYKYH